MESEQFVYFSQLDQNLSSAAPIWNLLAVLGGFFLMFFD
jgi:hypothetical protein